MARRSFWGTLSLSIFITPCIAQTKIIPTGASSQFPACAVSCAILQQAQQLCFPPVVAVTNQIAYENCFCQSASLGQLYGTTNVVCAGECTTAADRTLLQSWFTGFCAQVGRGVDPLATTTSTTPSVTVVTVTSTNTPAATSTSDSSASSSSSSNTNQSWISTHWQWIVMVGVLIVGFAGITVFAVWLKRRYRRKRDDRRAVASGFPTAEEKRYGARSATPDLWGPHQHMAATQGFEYNHHQDKQSGSGKGAGRKKRRPDSERTTSHFGQKQPDDLAISEIASTPGTLQKKSSYRDAAKDSEISRITETPQDSWYESKRQQKRLNRSSSRDRA